jgi:rare lipoprotein A (peptidoglycan hydrolase)
MHLRILEHTNIQTRIKARIGKITYRKPKNALVLVPLVIFTTVYTLPHNALAFESTLPTAKSAKLIAPVTVVHANDQSENEDTDLVRPPVLIAATSPITQPADWVVAPPPPAPAPAPVTPVSRPIPTLENPIVLEGEASYYSRAGCLGCSPSLTMANGQPLDDNALTMAIGADKKHLVGYNAKVTSLATGKSVVVRITDTGGFYQARYGHRVADLTIATKEAIGMRGGVGQVRVEIY